MVPEGWELVQAERLCERISVGIVVKPADYYVPEGQGTRAFRSANVREGKVEDKNWVYISDEGNRINKKSVLKAGDILIVRTGYPGTACVVPREYEGSNCIDIIFARPDTTKVIPEYLCTFTNSEHGRRQVLDGQGGLAQQHFNVGAFKQLELPLPPLPEQQKIAEILGTWDKAIETTEALLANARTQKRALMQSLLTGTRRFPGFEDQPWREEKLEKLEDMGWVKLGRGNVISKKDIEANPGEHPIYSSSVVGDGMFGRYGSYMFDEEMITWSVDGGGHFFHRKRHRFSVTNVCGWMKADLTKLHYGFLAAQLQSLHSRLEFNYQSKAHPSVIRSIYTLVVPSLEEQQLIGQVALESDEAINLLFNQLDHLRNEKKSLMQQLLTGKRRVAV